MASRHCDHSLHTVSKRSRTNFESWTWLLCTTCHGDMQCLRESRRDAESGEKSCCCWQPHRHDGAHTPGSLHLLEVLAAGWTEGSGLECPHEKARAGRPNTLASTSFGLAH